MATTKIAMPNLGQTAAECKVVSWLKAEGDRVERGDALAEVETDKATVQVETFVGGFLRKIIHPAPAVVSAGDTIALITSSADEPVEDDGAAARVQNVPPAAAAERQPAASPPPPAPAQMVVQAAVPAVPAPSPTSEPRVLATPTARKLAEELGVDLALVVGSSRGGRILESDVRAQAESARRATEKSQTADLGVGVASDPKGLPRPLGSPGSVVGDGGDGQSDLVELSGVRRATAVRMVQSVHEAPQFALSVDVDLTEAERLRSQRGQATGKKPSYTALIAKVVATALRRQPVLNVAFEGGRLRMHHDVNLGIAMATPRGLLVPVIRGADRLSLDELGAAIETLRTQAGEGHLTLSAASGGTFTISNLGMYNIDRFTAILNPPEAGILAVGRINYRPVSVGTAVESRLMVTLTLTVDHRAVDGIEAAGFLGAVRALLENPYDLI